MSDGESRDIGILGGGVDAESGGSARVRAWTLAGMLSTERCGGYRRRCRAVFSVGGKSEAGLSDWV